MTSNPYAPPTARVADAIERTSSGSSPPFFAVSLVKLSVLSFFTFGLYEVYWFYKQWHRIRDRERSNLLPAARAIFAVLFCYACFARIAAFGRKRSVSPPLSAGGSAIGWIVLTVLSRLPDPYWWISMFAFVALLPVQDYANRVNAVEAPNADTNSRFSAWNWVGIAVGGLVAALAILGSLSPVHSPS